MQDLVKGLVAMLAISMSVAGCASSHTGHYDMDREMEEKRMMFSKSPYGMEMKSMMNVCIAMQQNGDLPGVMGGEDKALELVVEPVDFSKKDDVSYPLQMKCMLIKDDQTQPFTFNKETMDADWMLVR